MKRYIFAMVSNGKMHVTLHFTTTVVCSFVTAKAVIETGPQDQTVRWGETVTLNCLATGHPKPGIHWLNSSTPVGFHLRVPVHTYSPMPTVMPISVIFISLASHSTNLRSNYILTTYRYMYI